MPKKNILIIIFELLILFIFIPAMFSLNIFTGIFYLIAIIGAFKRKLLFNKKNIAWMIIGGTILSYGAGLLFPYVLGNYLSGNIISAIIIGAIAIAIWFKGFKLKTGKKK